MKDGEEHTVTVTQWDVSVQMWARTCWLLIIGRILFCSVVSVNIQWLVLQWCSSVDQMCHIVRWERFSLLVALIKCDRRLDSRSALSSLAIFISPYMSHSDICHVVKLDNLPLYFGDFSPPPSRHTYAENNVLLWPMLCNLLKLSVGTRLLWDAYSLSAAGTSVCGRLGLQTPVGLGSWWHLSTFPVL